MIEKKIGYYVCDGISFQSKVDALLYSKTTNKPVEWIFFQDEFSKYNWQIEPEESLDDLYDRRAKQLRDKYDYIAICFSGGADSNNMVQSFIRQGLHIDEILTAHNMDAAKKTTFLDPNVKSSSNFAAEHALQAVPRLNEFKNIIPRTKITIIDNSELPLHVMSSFNDESWIKNKSDALSITTLYRFNIFNSDEFRKRVEGKKNIAILIGIDKPKTVIRPDGLYISFNDVTINAPGASINGFNGEYDNINIEPFYWSPDSLPILCKQAHTIKRWLEQHKLRQQYWTSIGLTQRVYQEACLRNVLYTTWNDDWFQAYKSTNWWQSDVDGWFRNDPELSREFQIWKSGIDYLNNILGPSHIRYNQKGEPEGFHVFAQNYFIGKLKDALV